MISKHLKYSIYHAFSLPHGHFGQQKWYFKATCVFILLSDVWLGCLRSVDLRTVSIGSTVSTLSSVSTVAGTYAASASNFM